MPTPDQIAQVVREWVLRAESDLAIAAPAIKTGEDCPCDSVCFHAQQCVEKYLKALLSWKQIEFPRTHSIRVLLALTPPDVRPVMELALQDRLTEYATVTRYPGDYDPVMLSDAKAAMKVARRVRKEIRAVLPRAALRPRPR
jgi:HEPN domain-containing protein